MRYAGPMQDERSPGLLSAFLYDGRCLFALATWRINYHLGPPPAPGPKRGWSWANYRHAAELEYETLAGIVSPGSVLQMMERLNRGLLTPSPSVPLEGWLYALVMRALQPRLLIYFAEAQFIGPGVTIAGNRQKGFRIRADPTQTLGPFTGPPPRGAIDDFIYDRVQLKRWPR